MRHGMHLNGEEWHKTYMLLSDTFQYGYNLALKKEKELKNILFQEKKLILILDLDNTVLHSRTYPGYIHDPKFFGRLYKGKDIFQIPITGTAEGC